MENNEDTNTNLMDLLPNEMVFKIFENFESLTDLLTLPKVSDRFNLLSKSKSNRNHLIFRDHEIAACCVNEFNMNMEDEINKCRDLKAVTYVASSDTDCDLTFLNDGLVKSMFTKALSRNLKHEIKEDDIDSLYMSNGELSINSYFKKKSADDMSRVVKLVPSALLFSAKGIPKLFQTAIEKNTDTLYNVTYEGTNITFAHLNALGKCKKLSRVMLTGDLVVSEEVPENFLSIQAVGITLKGNFHCPYVANIFFTETLERLSARFSTITGFKNEFLSKCTKIKFLIINMESEIDNIRNHLVVASIIELVNTLKHHKTLLRITIYNVNQYIFNILPEPLSACLESIAGSDIERTDTLYRHPAFFVTLNR